MCLGESLHIACPAVYQAYNADATAALCERNTLMLQLASALIFLLGLLTNMKYTSLVYNFTNGRGRKFVWTEFSNPSWQITLWTVVL